MYGRSRVNVKVKARLIFTSTPDLSYITSIIFTRVKITRQWKSTLTRSPAWRFCTTLIGSLSNNDGDGYENVT